MLCGSVMPLSRKGNCYDNGVMENFFGHLNAETYHGGVLRVLRSSSRLLMSMFLGYNNNRFQERLKGLGSGGVSE